MHRLVETHREELTRLCQQYHVQRLELFGSAATDRFDPETSDLDFLVTFEPLNFGEYAKAYFDFLAALEDLFQRHIDLVIPSTVDNPYFLKEMAKTRTLLYAA